MNYIEASMQADEEARAEALEDDKKTLSELEALIRKFEDCVQVEKIRRDHYDERLLEYRLLIGLKGDLEEIKRVGTESGTARGPLMAAEIEKSHAIAQASSALFDECKRLWNDYDACFGHENSTPRLAVSNIIAETESHIRRGEYRKAFNNIMAARKIVANQTGDSE